LLVSEVMARYLEEHAPNKQSARNIADFATDILQWWGPRPLSDVNGRNCRTYIDWRTSQRVARHNTSGRHVGTQTARNELAILRAAINYYHREHGPLQSVPAVTLPPKTPPREDYFLTRDEIAKRIRIACRSHDTRHLARFMLVGFYTGTRPGALLKLRWLPSTDGGWIDLGNEVIHRRSASATRNKKRQPPVRIHARLLPHLRRWHRHDTSRGLSHVIHYAGKPIGRVTAAWQSVCEAAGGGRHDTPHILRHTAATMFMASGVDVALVAGYLGMTVDVLQDVYGHHHPMFQDTIAQTTPRKQTNRK
jgi:integrase